MIFNQHTITAGGKHTLFKIYHSQVDPGRRAFREHHHTAFAIALFLSGSGTYTVKHKAYTFQRDDIFLFSTNEVHCITEIEPYEPLDIINIHFEPRFLWSQTSGLSSVGLLRIFFDRSPSFENRLPQDNPATAQIKAKILAIEQEFAEKKPEYENMVKIILFQLLIQILRHFDYVAEKIQYSAENEKLHNLNQAMEYIETNLSKDLSLAEIASIANYSKAYFSSQFKKYNGLSPWDYITIRRIEEAIELLKHTDLTKSEIAFRCGFNNTANFYKAFRKITGKTPSDFDEKS
jgi:AraC-like DNA-binding protein/mannose-6-phosphate isomerase-like protein (cupin superfamily)